MTNSVVPMAKALRARISSERGTGQLLVNVGKSGRVVQLFNQRLNECLYDFFVASEEMPLANLLAADQASALQGRQMGRDSGLGQSCTLIDLSGAHAVFNQYC